MTPPLALSLARRELRGGVGGFGTFLACLALGVAAIAGIEKCSAEITIRQQHRNCASENWQ